MQRQFADLSQLPLVSKNYSSVNSKDLVDILLQKGSISCSINNGGEDLHLPYKWIKGST